MRECGKEGIGDGSGGGERGRTWLMSSAVSYTRLSHILLLAFATFVSGNEKG